MTGLRLKMVSRISSHETDIGRIGSAECEVLRRGLARSEGRPIAMRVSQGPSSRYEDGELTVLCLVVGTIYRAWRHGIRPDA